jgi:heat shock protein HtpX
MRITAALLSPYWQSVVTPALAAGYLPPVAEGLARFMATPSISQRSSEFLSQALQNSKGDAYDTHPPLAARIEAAQKIGAPSARSLDLSPATGLLDNLDGLEAALLAKLSPNLNLTNMKRLDWDTAGAAVYLPLWRSQIAEHSSAFAGLTAASLADIATRLDEIGARIPDPKGMLLDREQRNNRVAGMLSHTLAVALVDRGWQLHLQPGSFYLELGEIRLVPSELIQQLRSGAMKADQWLALCAKYELNSVNLGGSSTQPSSGEGDSFD